VGVGALSNYVRIYGNDTYDYALESDTYVCVSDGENYLLEDGYTEVDGEYYHPDNAPEPEETEEEVVEGLAHAQACIDRAVQATLIQTA
jgi:hypothetical protein